MLLFRYIEYFATDSSFWNKGYGTQALQTFCNLSDRAVILEIELTEEEMALRRKNFYERNGISRW